MSNYSKTTDFAAKDSLSTGNANKIVKGTEINDEFAAIQTAVNTKADINSATLTGTPAAPTASASTNNTQISTTAYVTSAITTAVAAAKAALFPVGTIYTQAAVATNPATLLGFGTWEAFGAGKVMVGIDSGNTAFDTLNETGGVADSIIPAHTHTASSAVTDNGHFHSMSHKIGLDGSFPQGSGSSTASDYNTNSATTGITVATTVNSAGESATNKNLQPYIVVYMWKRTA
jgi:hypothetical protein